MKEMSLLHWMLLEPPYKGYYKECVIDDFLLVGERHVMVYLLLPSRHGEMIQEIIPLDTMIEAEEK